MFADEEAAIEYLEAPRWPRKRKCPKCGDGKKTSPTASKNHRPGLYCCGGCKSTFTVTIGTIFEGSHVPLNKWLFAFHLIASSKKGISGMQVHRMVGVSYKTAWFMCHRVREAMATKPDRPLGNSAPVEVDETYWGNKGKQRYGARGYAHKMKILSMVERKGEKRSFHLQDVKAATVTPILKANISADARVMTDEAAIYKRINRDFGSHETVNHGAREYARGDVTTNTVESSFAVLKRGLYGTFHQVSEKHLHRYLTEFDFRWNTRELTDQGRMQVALMGTEGKKLSYWSLRA
ncbi:hypothetical protein PI87_27755 [Ralstonia sp. A12]|nr:hypothetical protein PI87_27755 [Ralstonia sp. A12]